MSPSPIPAPLAVVSVQQPAVEEKPQLGSPTTGAPAEGPPYHFDVHGNPQLAFRNVEEARAYRRRVTMKPFLTPCTDPTITIVYNHREAYVTEMVRAVYNLEGALDKPKARERTMFNSEHPGVVCGHEVEAACWVLFDTIMDRCYAGFRGLIKDNKSLAPRFKEGDRNADCETRMQNVIGCLRQWKAACRDIIYDEYRCILLANHPLAYASNKAANQRNNNTKKATLDKSKAALAQVEEQNAAGELARVQGNLLPKPDPDASESVMGGGAGETWGIASGEDCLYDFSQRPQTLDPNGLCHGLSQPLDGAQCHWPFPADSWEPIHNDAGISSWQQEQMPAHYGTKSHMGRHDEFDIKSLAYQSPHLAFDCHDPTAHCLELSSPQYNAAPDHTTVDMLQNAFEAIPDVSGVDLVTKLPTLVPYAPTLAGVKHKRSEEPDEDVQVDVPFMQSKKSRFD